VEERIPVEGKDMEETRRMVDIGLGRDDRKIKETTSLGGISQVGA